MPPIRYTAAARMLQAGTAAQRMPVSATHKYAFRLRADIIFYAFADYRRCRRRYAAALRQLPHRYCFLRFADMPPIRMLC